MLHGILDVPAVVSKRAVLIIVGGPQYRVGSHRQFTLLSRYLAAHGLPSMRFDHRGIGDSDGQVSFDRLEPDIAAAADKLCAEVPEIREIVLWGLCDAASAAMMYAPTDARIRGLILLNPWVRDDKSLAQVYLKRYYVSQFFNINFWRRLFSGKLDIADSLKSLSGNLFAALKPAAPNATHNKDKGPQTSQVPFQQRMEQGLRRFNGNVLFIISGEDLTGTEFRQMTYGSSGWQKILRGNSVSWQEFPEANHTFSRREWRERVEHWSHEWISSW